MRSRTETYWRRIKARKRRFWESQRFWVAVMWVAIALFAVWYWQHPHVMEAVSRWR